MAQRMQTRRLSGGELIGLQKMGWFHVQVSDTDWDYRKFTPGMAQVARAGDSQWYDDLAQVRHEIIMQQREHGD